jgi:hypothetical protein
MAISFGVRQVNPRQGRLSIADAVTTSCVGVRSGRLPPVCGLAFPPLLAGRLVAVVVNLHKRSTLK